MDKKTSPKSPSTKATPSTSKASAKAAPKQAIPSQEEIALRAYFISERRQQLGWKGDHASDWRDAEQQLIAEAK